MTRIIDPAVACDSHKAAPHRPRRVTEPHRFDLCRPTAEDLAAVSEELGLHPLAVGDAVHEHERPKLDRYASHLFVTAYAVALDTATGQLDTCEVAAFVTAHALVTVRKDERFAIDEVTSRWDGSPDLAKHGVGFLLHGLLDYVVDSHPTMRLGVELGSLGLDPADQVLSGDGVLQGWVVGAEVAADHG